MFKRLTHYLPETPVLTSLIERRLGRRRCGGSYLYFGRIPQHQDAPVVIFYHGESGHDVHLEILTQCGGLLHKDNPLPSPRTEVLPLS